MHRPPVFCWGLCVGWLLAAGSLCAGEPLRVGIAVTEITPPLGYPMAGYFHARGATGVLDPLQAKAIVFQQGDRRAALLVADLIGIERQLADAVRTKVTAATGIPADAIALSATHTHTGPEYRRELRRTGSHVESESLSGANAAEKPTDYIPWLIDRLAGAIIRADESTQPMSLAVTTGREDTVAFNRRFILKDGTVRTWAKLADDDVVRAAGPTDPAIELITFTSAEKKLADAMLVNFSLHCDTVAAESKSEFSADYPGQIERVLTKELGRPVVSIFATAPCGDINHSDPTGKARRNAPQIGELIAKAAAKALPEAASVVPNLGVRRAEVSIPLQTYTDEDLDWAKDVQNRRDAGEKFPTTTAAKASKILRLQKLRTGDSAVDSIPAEVQVFRLADEVALVMLPGEVFVELGLAIEKQSPFAHTIVIELSNDNPAYIPTKQAMGQGGYEVANSVYAPGGGEKLVETAVKLLNALAK